MSRIHTIGITSRRYQTPCVTQSWFWPVAHQEEEGEDIARADSAFLLKADQTSSNMVSWGSPERMPVSRYLTLARFVRDSKSPRVSAMTKSIHKKSKNSLGTCVSFEVKRAGERRSC